MAGKDSNGDGGKGEQEPIPFDEALRRLVKAPPKKKKRDSDSDSRNSGDQDG